MIDFFTVLEPPVHHCAEGVLWICMDMKRTTPTEKSHSRQKAEDNCHNAHRRQRRMRDKEKDWLRN